MQELDLFYNRIIYREDMFKFIDKPATTCSKLTIKTLEQDVKYVQS